MNQMMKSLIPSQSPTMANPVMLKVPVVPLLIMLPHCMTIEKLSPVIMKMTGIPPPSPEL